jgi:hypothetical protein
MIEITHAIKHMGRVAPRGVYKIKGEGIGGRKQDYSLIDLANMTIPESAVEGVYKDLYVVSRPDLSTVCTNNPIRFYKNGTNPANYIVLLYMMESDNVWSKVALYNKNSNRVELYTSAEIDNIDGMTTTQCINPKCRVGYQCSLSTDIKFWNVLKIRCQEFLAN